MLLQVVSGLHGKVSEVHILDDCSSFDPEPFFPKCSTFLRNKERAGKRRFWFQWKQALEICKRSEAELFVFMPDDFLDLEIEKVVQVHSVLKSQPYACNIINCGRTACWTPIQKSPVRIGPYKMARVGFVDCGFFCNYSTLGRLVFSIEPVKDSWFDSEAKSSGVGMQLSNKFFKMRVQMYMPEKSFAFHGEHSSVMHPEERKKNHLISK